MQEGVLQWIINPWCQFEKKQHLWRTTDPHLTITTVTYIIWIHSGLFIKSFLVQTFWCGGCIYIWWVILMASSVLPIPACWRNAFSKSHPQDLWLVICCNLLSTNAVSLFGLLSAQLISLRSYCKKVRTSLDSLKGKSRTRASWVTVSQGSALRWDGSRIKCQQNTSIIISAPTASFKPRILLPWLLFSENCFVALGVVVACGLKGRHGYEGIWICRLAVVFLCERGFKEGVKNNNDLGYNLGSVFARHNSAFKGFLFGHRRNAEFGSPK